MTLILSFLQQYFTKLSERTVAYINVDIAVFGKKFHLHYLSEVNEKCLVILSVLGFTWTEVAIVVGQMMANFLNYMV